MAVFNKGDIIEFDFSPSIGHEPAGRRPALVVSNSKYNTGTSMTMVCPIMTFNNGFPLHLELPADLDTYGIVAVEQVRAFDLENRNSTYVEHIDVDSEFMQGVTECIISFVK